MRTDLIMMACLAVFAVAMVATADLSSSTPDTADAGQTAKVEPNRQAAQPVDQLPDQTLSQSPQEADQAQPVSNEVTPQSDPLIEPKCATDCASQSGYRWAQMHEIVDADDCSSGDSAAFIEGCRTYAEEQTQLGANPDASQKLGEP
jgi:hypothetical protein